MNKHLAFIEWIKQNPAIDKLYVVFADTAERDPYWLFSPTSSTYRRKFITGGQELQYDVTMAQFASVSTECINAALKGGYANGNETIKALFDTESLIDWVEEQGRVRNFPAFDGCMVESVEAVTRRATPAAVSDDWAKFTLMLRVTYTTY